ncbi:MAG: chromosomal replication initiator protein DnaA [Chthoniobacterales bacterium]|nr:chromosomal replication initiator protein DnaA [Chthoniobacterales bacterium]
MFEEQDFKTYENKSKNAGLKIDFTFENYAVGGSNQLAFAAAQAVAKNPGKAYNPLFIYGGVGVGKTHLMHGIGHEAIKKGETVRCCTGEEFTNDLVEAIRDKNTERVRNKYRKVRMLLIDDVQFIAGKPSVQEEFFHTFNAILKEGGQVVMTSDKPPAEISRMEERLRSRFGGGLIVDIGQPDFELRTAILLIKAKQLGINLNMETAQKIAQKVEGVRELQGVLMRLMNRPGDVDRAIIGSGEKEVKLVSPQQVIAKICSFYGVTTTQLKSKGRTKSVVWPRQVAMFFLVNEMRLAQEEVGRLLGGRDHSTVIHARDKIGELLASDERIKREYETLKRQLTTNGG